MGSAKKPSQHRDCNDASASLSSPSLVHFEPANSSNQNKALQDISQKIDSLQRATANIQGEMHEMKTMLNLFLKESTILKRERIW